MADESLDTPDIVFLTFPGGANPAFYWDDKILAFQSPVSGQAYILRQWGKWRCTYEWIDVPQRQAEQIRAAFSRYGLHTPYKVVDVVRLAPRGDFTDAQLDRVAINGTGSVGQALQLKTLTPAVTNTSLFLAGDLVKVLSTGEIYEVTSDVSTDGSGLASVPIAQFIRVAPSADEVVKTRQVSFLVRSTSVVKPTLGPGVPMYSFTVDMEQHI